MKANWKKSWWSVLTFFLLAVVSSGCMTERSPIDQTNPLAMDKRLFEGEFFFKQTAVDMPESVDYVFPGETNDMKIIRWEITKDYLIAYNIHEHKEVADLDGTPENERTPILAFPILSHFDIQLAQSSTTGEDLPMLVENRDKPWYQARYFVFDPSKNLIMGVPFDMTYLKLAVDLWHPFTREPVAGYKNMEFHDKYGDAINPKDYELRHMSTDSDQKVETFAFETEMILTENNSYRGLRSWSDVAEYINWEPARVGFRHFFWKVDRDELNSNGFKTTEHQDEMFRRFGYFVDEYRSTDNYYGYRDSLKHQWARHFNLNNNHRIELYLGPDFPEDILLSACAIAADYNWVFSKAKYEQEKAEQSFAENGVGFESDFPEQIKLADGLYELNTSAAPTSFFNPDAKEPWPSDLKLDDSKFYALDYLLADYAVPGSWDDELEAAKEAGADNVATLEQEYNDKVAQFEDLQGKMTDEMFRYCFRHDFDYDANNPGEQDAGRYVLRKNSFLEYDYNRDGVNPEGLPNLITPNEILAKYGERVNNVVARPVDYPVACRMTLEHRCELDGDGHKIPRYKAELGDPRYSMIYWIDKFIGTGFLGVAQYSTNPETGQIFSSNGHIAGALMRWWVTSHLERFYMIDALKEEGLNLTGDRYEELLNDIIVDTSYMQTPKPSDAEDTLFKTSFNKDMPLSKVKVGSEQWHLSTLNQPYYDVERKRNNTFEADVAGKNGLTQAEYLAYQKDRHLPLKVNNNNLEDIRGTKWERHMTPNGLFDFVFADATSYDEDMLYQISPLYWASEESMERLKERDVEFSKACYLQPEWLDSGMLELMERFSEAGYSREEMRPILEKMAFKGTTIHELGHGIGLRHNFKGNADENNFIGSKKDGLGYWAVIDKDEEALAQKIAEFETDNGREATPQEKFLIKRSLPRESDLYSVSSVMEYSNSFYQDAFGLGRYDIAAILFMYGRSVEKYKINGSNQVETNPVGLPTIVVEPMFETRYCTANDIQLDGCLCVPGAPREGEVDADCECLHNMGIEYCYNKSNVVEGIRYSTPLTLVTDNSGALSVTPDPDKDEPVMIQLNGDVKPYLFCSDYQTWQDPMCNRFDKGLNAREIVRNLGEDYKRRYYYRFFRRGNPRFRVQNWSASYTTFFQMAHFALDYNYNKFQIPAWQDTILDSSENPFPKNDDGSPAYISQARKEYLLALNGVEEWEETINGVTVKKTFTPAGPGDYLVAGMEGFNFLVYDVMYSPDVGKHVLQNWKNDSEKKFFLNNPYVYSDEDLEDTIGGAILNIDLRYGHYHKNRWDFQDDKTILEAKPMRSGFTIEKDLAMYVLASTGWPVDKYRYESMANGFAYVSDGWDNAIYHLLSDQLNENALYSLSPNCAEEVGTNQYNIKRYQPRTNELFLWNWTEDFADGPWKPAKSDVTKSLCQKMTDQQGASAPYIPVHGSWQYFDSMFPALWAMYNQANIMADNMVYEYYYALKIPVNDISTWDPIADTDENVVQCVNSKETFYYRAYKFPGDERDNPIFNIVSRCKDLQDMCRLDASIPQGPGNMVDKDAICGDSGYPRWYVNRDLEYIESKLILLRGYGDFWTDVTNLFF